ncbi:hypothetical protein ACN4EK_09800 [Pantanalinema rosaneae CENA516]|uniref:hypothetical protein n=1 Tax=Pantanalinema rosaneae TaxID=1620701 RepID=UPI003D6FE591
MPLHLTRSAVAIAMGWIAFGMVAPALSSSTESSILIAQRGGQCRRVVSIQGGPEFPRAVAGADYNQLPVFNDPNDLYNPGVTPVRVVRVGESVTLSDPYEERVVAEGTGTAATIMVAINDNGTKRWIPVTDARRADGAPVGASNLAYCAVPALW